MPRINMVEKKQAIDSVKELYSGIEGSGGKIINIFKNMGNSPVVLKSYLDIGKNMKQSVLPESLREEITLVVSQQNNCQYCLSAHTAVAKSTGLQDQQILMARKGVSDDPKTEAILQFAKHIVDNKGFVQDDQISNLKKNGVNDREIVEIILVVIVAIFTNYFNHITEPEIDFPRAPELN